MLLTRLGARMPGMMAVSRMITASFVFRSRVAALVLFPIFRCNVSPTLRRQHNGQPGQRCLARRVSCFRMVGVPSLIPLAPSVLLRNVVREGTIYGHGHQQTMVCHKIHFIEIDDAGFHINPVLLAMTETELVGAV